MNTKTVRTGQRGKSEEERVGFALSHHVRVHVLTLLNEGVYTADDIASLIGESRQNVNYHLKELHDAGSVEIAKEEKRRNAVLYYYRAVEMPIYSQDEWAALSPAERQGVVALTVQCSIAELMAALATGKLSNDPRVTLVWRWFHLDRIGRALLADEHDRFWERVQEIELEALTRSAATGEETKPYIVSEWGFERARSAPVLAGDAD